VAYDALIIILMIAGISTALVYSYKITHSRVYPVGMVREFPDALKSIEIPTKQPTVKTTPIVWEVAPEKDAWRCESCGLVQPRKKGFQCRRCKQISSLQATVAIEKMEESLANEPDQVALGRDVAEHSQALKLYSRMFKDLEKRIRQLEVEAVQKSQEAAQENPRQQELIH
jgi:hypothetical protein